MIFKVNALNVLNAVQKYKFVFILALYFKFKIKKNG